MMMLHYKHTYKMAVGKFGGVAWWIFGVLSSGIISEVFGVITNGPVGENVHSRPAQEGNSSHNSDTFEEDTGIMSNQTADNTSVANEITHGSTATPRMGETVKSENRLTSKLSRTPSKYSLPNVWSEFCQVVENETYESEFTNRTNLTSIKCTVDTEYSGLWTMEDLRENIRKHKDLNRSFSVEINCNSMANISLSWPFKVYNLLRLTVDGCTILEFLAEKDSDYLDTIPDTLRLLHIRNSLCLVRLSRLVEATGSIKYVKKEFDCLHDETIEDTSMRNVSFDFILDDEYILTQILERGIKFLQDTRRISHVCDYVHLMSVDESISTSRARYHTDLMTDNSIYDELRVYNVSNTYIKVLKDQYLQWSRKFPKLETLDLSHNDIAKLYQFALPLRANSDIATTIDLRYNRISTISVGDLEMFKSMPLVFYDLRNNAIDCNCSDTLEELVRYIKGEKHLLISNLSDYSYIENLKCKNPEKLEGIALKSLTSDMICESTIQTEYFLVPIICLGAAIVILAVLLFIVLRFRQEITIILFTRFNIIIPCQTRENFDSNKKYDAFVSYSSNEEEYVEKLFEDLEKQPDDNSRPAFKFCMHHRDFVPGRTIFDNVTYSVESSRHTIILLSNHFIKSEFCLYEFQEAFRQSIMEKRRHLLIVMMEDIPEDKLPRDLRRCVKTFTYIRKDDFLFTERLVYALSIKHKGKTVVKSTTKHAKDSKTDKDSDCRTNDANTSSKKETDITPSAVKAETNSQTEMNSKLDFFDSVDLSESVKYTKFEKQQKYKKKILSQNGEKLNIAIKHINDFNLSPIERKLNNKELDYDRSLSLISQDTGYGSERGSICERLSPDVAVDMEEFPAQAVVC